MGHIAHLPTKNQESDRNFRNIKKLSKTYFFELFPIGEFTVEWPVDSISSLVLEDNICTLLHLRLGHVTNGSIKLTGFDKLVTRDLEVTEFVRIFTFKISNDL